MHIIKGTVLGVVDKGEPDKRWAIVALQTSAKDRDGFDVTTTVKARVFGDSIKNGLHNPYRQQVGVEVFMPVTCEVNDRYHNIDYLLAGTPLRLQEVRPQPAPNPAATAQQKAAGAN
ncbi:hypothetical protein PSCT_04569 [Pseudomonas sp. SCT]|uniref:hypothetical protein n=1 Tax=Pseudomonas sp. (strain SCT) TaxID=412955 RepID=UPI000ECE05EF|nr:hypothetical protein [Pseudomonas sp. SCT]GCA58344.1 hypothetical protein PSCT_04569 [Pseudomonas sp. SCT]